MINPMDGSLLVYAENPARRQKLNAAAAAAASSNGEMKTAPPAGQMVDHQMTGVTMWGELFKYISKLPVGAEKRRGFILFPPPSQPQTKQVCVELQAVDLKVEKNGGDSSSLSSGPQNFGGGGRSPSSSFHQIRVKSGQTMELDFYFYREPDFNHDFVNLILEKENDRSVKFNVEIDGLKANKKKTAQNPSGKPLKGRLSAKDGEKFTADFQIPGDFSGGGKSASAWKMRITTSYKNNGGDQSECEYEIDGIYIE